MTPHPERLAYVRYAFEKGMTVREVARMTSMDPWFLNQMKQITDEIGAGILGGRGEVEVRHGLLHEAVATLMGGEQQFDIADDHPQHREE